jgi:ribonuclease HII
MGSGPGTESRGREVPIESGARASRSSRVSSLSAERARVAELQAEERRAWAAGFRLVAGVDEGGRGCLAGPVYAGAVILGEFAPSGLDDSKALLPEVREELARRIESVAVATSVGAATPAEIDSLGIVAGTLLAMRRALASLRVRPDHVLFDAVRLPGLGVPQLSFIRGDSRVACIAAASIVAKTARDAFLARLDAHFPYYGFVRHKGYATTEHLQALRRHGPSPVHRLSFDRVLPVAAERAA